MREGFFSFLDLRLLSQQLLNPFIGNSTSLADVKKIACSLQRPNQHIQISDKGNQLSYGKLPLGYKNSTENQGQNIRKTDKKQNQGVKKRIVLGSQNIFFVDLLIGLGKRLSLRLLIAKGLGHSNP